VKCFRHDPGKVCPECGLDRRTKMKLKVQAQHLQPGDIVGSGEKVIGVIRASIRLDSNKVWVQLEKNDVIRQPCWGKYTLINVERAEKEEVSPNWSDGMR